MAFSHRSDVRSDSGVRRVRVACRTCGDQRIAASQVGARLCEDGTATYHFRCPVCGLLESRPLAASLVGALDAAGVELTWWSWPAELAEPHHGAPISVDDVLDFHLALQGEDWLEDLIRDVAR